MTLHSALYARYSSDQQRAASIEELLVLGMLYYTLRDRL